MRTSRSKKYDPKTSFKMLNYEENSLHNEWGLYEPKSMTLRPLLRCLIMKENSLHNEWGLYEPKSLSPRPLLRC